MALVKSDLTVNDGTEYRFRLVPGESGRKISLETKPWEDSLPGEPWREHLLPMDAGLFPSKKDNRRGYAGIDSTTAAADPSYGGIIAGPTINTATLTSATIGGVRAQVFDVLGGGGVYVLADHLYEVNVAFTVSDLRTLSTSTVYDLAVFNNELIIARGPSTNIQRMTAAEAFTNSTDSVFRNALCTRGDVLYGAVTNSVRVCSTTPLTGSNWSVVDTAGDTTWDVHALADFNGELYAFKGDGVYLLTARGFQNVCPQMAAAPHADNGKRPFFAHGMMLVPWVGGLLNVDGSNSVPIGPEVVGLPNHSLRVWDGVEHGGAIYLLCQNSNSGTQEIWKMVADTSGVTGRRYKYFLVANQDGTVQGKWIVAFTGANTPCIMWGGGSVATQVNYMAVPVGVGRIIDSTTYSMSGSACSIMSGNFWPADEKSGVCRLVGVEAFVRTQHASDSVTLAFKADDIFTTSSSSTSLLTTQEGGGTAAITGATGAARYTRYAPTTTAAQGTVFNIIVTIDNNAAQTGTSRTEIVELDAFGVMHPKMTDYITCSVFADSMVRVTRGGLRPGVSGSEMERLWRDWQHEGTVLTGEIEDYENGRTTRFVVVGVEWKEIQAKPQAKGTIRPVRALDVTLARLDYSGTFADA